MHAPLGVKISEEIYGSILCKSLPSTGILSSMDGRSHQWNATETRLSHNGFASSLHTHSRPWATAPLCLSPYGKSPSFSNPGSETKVVQVLQGEKDQGHGGIQKKVCRMSSE